jgi:alpha-L-rhamnosidase
MYGVVRSAWRNEGGAFTWKISVPVNSVATAYVPAADAQRVREIGKALTAAAGVKFLRSEGGRVVVELGSGDYELVCVSP